MHSFTAIASLSPFTPLVDTAKMKKKPARVITAPMELLGRTYGDPFVEATQKYRQYTLIDDEGAYGVVLDEETTYKPEELVAMQLRHVTKHADGVAKRGPIKDAVLIVPPFKTHHERQALISAAEIADLNVLTLINEGFAGMIPPCILSVVQLSLTLR